MGAELEELARVGLIGSTNPGADGDYTSSALELGFGYLKTTRRGRVLAELMRLETLAEAELREVAKLLQPKPSPQQGA